MSAKHTPGPWSKLPSGEDKFIPLRAHHCEKLGFCIGFVNYDITDDHGSIPAANARLIAAAPEMLAALQACHEAMSYMSEYDIPLTLPGQVKDAIAKAIG